MGRAGMELALLLEGGLDSRAAGSDGKTTPRSSFAQQLLPPTPCTTAALGLTAQPAGRAAQPRTANTQQKRTCWCAQSCCSGCDQSLVLRFLVVSSFEQGADRGQSANKFAGVAVLDTGSSH